MRDSAHPSRPHSTGKQKICACHQGGRFVPLKRAGKVPSGIAQPLCLHRTPLPHGQPRPLRGHLRLSGTFHARAAWLSLRSRHEKRVPESEQGRVKGVCIGRSQVLGRWHLMRPSIAWSFAQYASPIQQISNLAAARPARSRRTARFVTVLRGTQRAPELVVCHLWQEGGE